jgi:hypothetical protein
MFTCVLPHLIIQWLLLCCLGKSKKIPPEKTGGKILFVGSFLKCGIVGLKFDV